MDRNLFLKVSYIFSRLTLWLPFIL